jgi:hypothetical protein
MSRLRRFVDAAFPAHLAMLAPTVGVTNGPTRTKADFASHIEQTAATGSVASWVLESVEQAS